MSISNLTKTTFHGELPSYNVLALIQFSSTVFSLAVIFEAVDFLFFITTLCDACLSLSANTHFHLPHVCQEQFNQSSCMHKIILDTMFDETPNTSTISFTEPQEIKIKPIWPRLNSISPNTLCLVVILVFYSQRTDFCLDNN